MENYLGFLKWSKCGSKQYSPVNLMKPPPWRAGVHHKNKGTCRMGSLCYNPKNYLFSFAPYNSCWPSYRLLPKRACNFLGSQMHSILFVCLFVFKEHLFHFPGGSDSKASVCNAGDLGSIPGEGNGNPLQYSCLENPTDGGAWCRLLSKGLQRVGHDWATSLHFTFHLTIEPGFSLLQRLANWGWQRSSEPKSQSLTKSKVHFKVFPWLKFFPWENSLVVFPTFFNLSLNLAIGVHDLCHSQILVLFLLTV